MVTRATKCREPDPPADIQAPQRPSEVISHAAALARQAWCRPGSPKSKICRSACFGGFSSDQMHGAPATDSRLMIQVIDFFVDVDAWLSLRTSLRGKPRPDQT